MVPVDDPSSRSCRKPLRLPLGDYRPPGAWYFVTICCRKKKPLLSSAQRREEVRRLLIRLAKGQKVELASCTILPDHLHFISSAGSRGLVGFVRDFKSATSRRLHEEGLRGLLWQRSFFDRKLRGEGSVIQKSEHVWSNPVRHRLARHAEEYPWSGALREGQHYSIGGHSDDEM